MTKTALVTGCSSGIGRATAEAFAADEWRVYATARDDADLAALDEAGFEAVALDVTNARRCERVVERVVDEAGRLDCLVNNAGYGVYGPVEDVPTEAVHDQFDVNVYGPHRLMRAALPHMRERGDGTIVNVSSVNGRIAVAGTGVYAGSKFALEAMSDAVRGEVAGEGVDVVLVEPGPVDTAFDERVTEEVDGLERSGAYGWLYDAIDDATVLGGDALAVPPREVALTIRDAALASDPEPRYPVGEFARIALLARHLPARWRDRVLDLLRTVAR